MPTMIEENATVLFIGDSITDAGRNRNDGASLGSGYALFAAGWFGALHPEKKVKFLNRGIGGHRVPDLQARWRQDCLELLPTWVSIYIGINDSWHKVRKNLTTTPEEFEAGYRDILSQTREALGARLVVVEPFVLPVKEELNAVRADLDPNIQIVRSLAREFGALFVPLDGIFAQAAARREPTFWANDGVHPTPAGHALIAQAWLRTVGAI